MTEWNNVPDAMRRLNQWVVWCAEAAPNSTRFSKVPYDPADPRETASTMDPESWGTFEQAVATADLYDRGIGFVFREGGGIFGIDIDSIEKVLPENREVAMKLREMIWNNFPTYCEASPSGKGMHYIGYGSLPEGMKGIKDTKYQIELYDFGRYFTVTGDVIAGRNTLADCQLALSELAITFSPVAEGEGWVTTSENDDRSLEDIIATVRRWQNGQHFEFLMGINGATQTEILSDYRNDHSSADFALLNYIGNATKDRNKAIEIFRRSPLWRGSKGGYTTEESYINGYLIKQSLERIWMERERKEAQQRAAIEQGREIAARMASAETVTVGKRTANRYNLTLPSVDLDNDGLTLPPGNMGELVKAVHQGMFNPNLAYALAICFAFTSGVCGRGYRFGRSGCNTFFLVAGKSTTGKTQAIDCLAYLMGKVKGLGLTDRPPVDRIINSAAKSAQGIHDHFLKVPAGAWFTDECASMLRALTEPQGNSDLELKDSINKLYDAAQPGKMWALSASRASSEKKSVNCLSIGIAWFTTLEKMYDSLSVNEAKDGFLSRFIPIFYEGELGPDNHNQIDQFPERVNVMVRTLATQASVFDMILGAGGGDDKLIHVKIDDKAAERLNEFNDASRQITRRAQRDKDELPEVFVAIGRIGSTAQRLATVMAVLDNPVMPVIMDQHVQWAIQFVTGRTLDVIRRIEDGELGSGSSNEVVTVIRIMKRLLPAYDGLVPAGILRDKLRLVNPFKKQDGARVSSYINQVLKGMEEEGRLKSGVSEAKIGRVGVVYTATDDPIWR